MIKKGNYIMIVFTLGTKKWNWDLTRSISMIFYVIFYFTFFFVCWQVSEGFSLEGSRLNFKNYHCFLQLLLQTSSDFWVKLAVSKQYTYSLCLQTETKAWQRLLTFAVNRGLIRKDSSSAWRKIKCLHIKLITWNLFRRYIVFSAYKVLRCTQGAGRSIWLNFRRWVIAFFENSLFQCFPNLFTSRTLNGCKQDNTIELDFDWQSLI